MALLETETLNINYSNHCSHLQNYPQEPLINTLPISRLCLFYTISIYAVTAKEIPNPS